MKTEKEKAAAGNPGKRDLKKDVEVQVEIPKCPMKLSPAAKREWVKRSIELEKAGLISGIDMAAFAMYCDSFGNWEDMNHQIKKTRLNLKRSGKTEAEAIIETKPLVAMAEKFKSSCLTFLKEFGMTPKARRTIKLNPENGKKKKSAMEIHRDNIKKLKSIK